jgi:hypothetical protein
MKNFMSKTFCFIVFLTILFSLTMVTFSQTEEPAKVRGRVTGYFGNPLEKVEVNFFLLEMKSGEFVSAGKFIKSVLTDTNGEYEITDLPWGEYRVSAIAFGFPRAEVWRFYLWRNAERVLDFGLQIGITHGFPQLQVSGTIKLKNKSPVRDATVTLINAFDETEIKHTRTGNDGKYKFQLIQPGQYIIYVSKPGFSVISSSFLINGLRDTTFPATEIDKNIDMELLPLDKSKVKN